MLNPIEIADVIFQESLNALMAHVVRGAQNQFRAQGVVLQVLIQPDLHNQLELKAPGHGVTSILLTNWIKNPVDYLQHTVRATIYIHPHANRNLARICVAHEVFHLLMELDEFVASGKTRWRQIGHSKEVEDKCNQFAWELCRKHDLFYRDEQHRNALVYFPNGLFNKPLNTDLNHQEMWGPGVHLDAEHPFYKGKYLG